MRRFTATGGGLWNCRPQKCGSVNCQPTQVEGPRGIRGRLQLGLRKDICPPAVEPLVSVNDLSETLVGKGSKRRHNW